MILVANCNSVAERSAAILGDFTHCNSHPVCLGFCDSYRWPNKTRKDVKNHNETRKAEDSHKEPIGYGTIIRAPEKPDTPTVDT